MIGMLPIMAYPYYDSITARIESARPARPRARRSRSLPENPAALAAFVCRPGRGSGLPFPANGVGRASTVFAKTTADQNATRILALADAIVAAPRLPALNQTSEAGVVRAQVGIIGPAPAGLFLANLLHRAGIEAVNLEARSCADVEGTVRAGVLEHWVTALMHRAGPWRADGARGALS